MPRPPLKAQAVAATLAKRIEAGVYESGDWLPSSRKLENDKEIDAERGTIDNAKRILEERGLVEIINGGAKVKPRPVPRRDSDLTHGVGSWRGFAAAATRAGVEHYTKMISVGEVAAPAKAAYLLGVPLETTVVERRRLHGHVIGGRREPVQLSTAWIGLEVAERAPRVRETDTGPGGISQRLEDAGFVLRHEEIVTARVPTAVECELLQVEAGHPLADIWRRTYDQSGRVIKASNRLVNTDMQELSYRYP